MTLKRRLGVGVALAALGGALLIGGAGRALAQPALPYVAYGVGLEADQVVEAFVGTTPVGRASADQKGQWRLSIEPGPTVADGDRVTFSVDGTPTGKSVIFEGGHFPKPPGIQLGATPASTPTPGVTPKPAPKPTATPAARSPLPRATSTPRPSARATPGCTTRGVAVPCAAPARATSTATR